MFPQDNIELLKDAVTTQRLAQNKQMFTNTRVTAT